jgi:hypothetical protein
VINARVFGCSQPIDLGFLNNTGGVESQGEAAQGEAAPPLTHTRAAPIFQCLNGIGDLAMAHAFSLGERVLFNPKVISGDVGFFSLVTSMDSQSRVPSGR